ncbi:hypothetical protein V8C86DRAFT_2644732 [Haematococcus lacustris]
MSAERKVGSTDTRVELVKAQSDFAESFRRHHEELVAAHVEPNEACALALRIAAGVAEAPISVAAVLESLHAAARHSPSSPSSQAVHSPTQDPLRLQNAAAKVYRLFSNPDALHAAFWLRVTPPPCQPAAPDNLRPGLCALLKRFDQEQVKELYAAITALKSSRVTTSLSSACERLLLFIASSSAAANPGLMRQLLVLLSCPLLEDLEHSGLLARLCSTVVGLLPEQRQALAAILSEQPAAELSRLVVVLQQYITITLYTQQAITPGVEDATKVLGVLNDANNLAASQLSLTLDWTVAPELLATRRRMPVPFAEFYNDAVNNEDFNLKEDFRRWKTPYRHEFSFCCHPFIYDPASKARVLQMENQMSQFNELHSALFRGLFSSSGQDMTPFFVIRVRRGPNLVRDTLVQVNRAKEQGELRKPLKVKFAGEEGVDEGGVQKEFFQLLVRELFNSDYGMFVYDETSRLHWFRASHMDSDTEFELVGILIGLAIYNAHILEFSFPLVLYKKLMGAKPTFEDLTELYPEVASSLRKLMLMTAEEVEACCLTFQVDMEVGFGHTETVDLVPGGSELPVTPDNRALYVEHYTQHLLDTATARQFAAFRQGFLRLCNGSALGWFRPQELELLVCGGRELDLRALEGVTVYDDGYTREDQVVHWFWEVAHGLSQEQKKRLLAFVTGSDRVPIKGLAHLNPPFVISKMGGDPDRLPTAHTCFNHLLLPVYHSRQSLQQRLETALENCEGFGLM